MIVIRKSATAESGLVSSKQKLVVGIRQINKRKRSNLE